MISGASSTSSSSGRGMFRFLEACQIARQGKKERRALLWGRFDPELPSMRLDDLLADCQAGACALELVTPMQPTENAEDLLVIARVDPHAIVADEQSCHRIPSILLD